MLFQRLGGFLTGNLSWKNLASDEIQLLVLTAVSASAALVGCILILRRMTMLANALSHTILIGIVIAFLFTRYGWTTGHDHASGMLPISTLLIAALVTGLLTSFLTQFLTKTVRLQEDASIGLVFTTLFALGIILVTVLTRDAHIGTEVVMGNVDALHLDDSLLAYLILAGNIVLFTLFFKEYRITTFDPGLAQALGFSVLFFDYLLMIQVSATAISAFRAVGVLMVLAFITGPGLTARLLTHDLKKMLVLAVFLAIGASFVGVALSRHLLTVYGMAFSTAGMIVCVILGFYLLAIPLRQR